MIIELLRGLLITFKHFFRKPITLKYPHERREPYPRFRGLPKLKVDENGKLKCVACCLCETVCPASAIYIEAAEDVDHQKYPSVFNIDSGRCIFCGYCEQACPMDAIEMTRKYELSEYDRISLVYDKKRLSQQE